MLFQGKRKDSHMKEQTVKLEMLTLGAGTQQRPLDQNLIEEYMALIKSGVTLPPIEIVRCGADYYVWDGFHRCEVARRLDKTHVMAYVVEGTLDKAIWMSFSANSTHGKPMARGVRKKIIQVILTDARWSKKSQAEIGRHVGVSTPYVSRIKTELLEKEKARSEAKKPDKALTKLTPFDDSHEPTVQRSETVTVKSATGKEYEQESQDKTQTPPKPVLDKAKNPIPENLVPVWERAMELQEQVNAVQRISKAVNDLVKARHDSVKMLNETAFKANVANLRRTLQAAMPHAVCCYCGGKGNRCEACGGFGFLNKHSHAAAPKDMKK